MSADRNQPTREALLDAAEELFAARGYADVGNRELVARAGANVAAIAYHFGSKRGLYLETVRRSCLRPEAQVGWDLLRAPAPDPPAAAARLVAFLRHWMTTILADSELACGGVLLLREAIRPSEALPELVEGFTRPNEDLLAQALEPLMPGAPLEELRLCARCLFGQVLIHRIYRPFFERHSAPNRYAADELVHIADHLARFSLRGLGCSEELVEHALTHAHLRLPTETIAPTAGEGPASTTSLEA